jgi:hypothetical protein
MKIEVQIVQMSSFTIQEIKREAHPHAWLQKQRSENKNPIPDGKKMQSLKKIFREKTSKN